MSGVAAAASDIKAADLAVPLPTTAREVTVAHPEDTVLVDMAADPREEAMADPLEAVLEGLAHLEVGSVGAEDIAGTSSAKGPVGMMIGMSSVHATSLVFLPVWLADFRTGVGSAGRLVVCSMSLPRLFVLSFPAMLTNRCLRKYRISQCIPPFLPRKRR